MANANARFADEVERELEQAGYSFDVEATVGGVRPDFVVHLPNGQSVILEVKSWAPSAENVERGLAEVAFFQRSLGVGEAIVVLPLAPPARNPSVVGLGDLVDRLTELGRWHHKGSVDDQIEPHRPLMFCAMPFDAEFDDVFHVGMAGAADKAGLAALRVDREDFVGDIVAHIRDRILEAVVVVADLSGASANVMYEVGYAHGVGRPVVPICSTMDELPFDVEHENAIPYERGRTHLLVDRLAKRLRAVGLT
jgi:hypothetical protein